MKETNTYYRWILFGLAIVAAILRLQHLSHGFGSHPDERFLIMRTLELEQKNFNPEFFAYGSLPFYLLWGVSRVFGWFDKSYIGYDGLFLVGRGLAVVAGVVTCLLLPLLARRLKLHPAVGLLAATFLAFNTFHIQLSRFFTVDIFLTLTGLLLVLACESFSRKPSFRRGAMVALFLGMSFAIKASALFLLVPVVVAVAFLVYNYNRSIWWGLGVFGLVGIWALVVMFICAPFTFLDFNRFWSQTMEQINMVAGKWRPPYTVQYEHTTPYLYHLKQMFFWTVGPTAFGLATTGLVFALKKLKYGFQQGGVIAVLFVAALFFSTAGLQVKFPRYLLPLYPFIALASAYGLYHLVLLTSRTRMRTISAYVAIALVAFELVRAVAAVRIYAAPHSYEIASRWIFNNIPTGSRLAGVHWDDSLPITLPGLDGNEYPKVEMPMYEPEASGKMGNVLYMMANSDYIVFPTQRIPGSILRIPEELPQTSELLDQLFQDKLGYRLVYSLKVDPELFGMRWSTDLADESLSVYDRPKIWIFKNEDHLSSAQMNARITERAGSPLVLGLNKVLQREAGVSAEEMELADSLSSPARLVQFMLVVLLISWIGSIYATELFGVHALLLGPSLGVFGLGLIMYLGKALQLLGSGSAAGWLVLAMILAGAFSIVRRSYGTVRNYLHIYHRDLIKCLLGMIGLSAAVFLARAFQPEVFWGEKPMDSSFLNYFLRGAELPATDPWASGNVMKYYYLGSFMIAEIIRLSGVPIMYAYNLGMGLVSVLLLTGVYGFVKVITRSGFFATMGLLVIAAGSNAEWLRLLLQGRAVNFDFFWATSRLFTSPQITEYPIWSQLFADLHAHVIALSLIPLGLTTVYFLAATNRKIYGVVFGVLWGMLFAINTWDFITLGFATAVIVALVEMSQLATEYWSGSARKSAWLDLLQRFTVRLGQGGCAILAASLVALPFYSESFASGVQSGWGFAQSEEFNTLGMMLRHVGIFVVPFLVLGTCLALVEERRRGYWFSYLPSLATPLMALLSVFSGAKDQPWGVLLLQTAVAAVCCRVLEISAHREKTTDDKVLTFGAALVYCGTILSSLTELFFLLDRMNTTFKVYNFIWILLGSGTLFVLKGAYDLFRARNARVSFASTISVAFVAFAISIGGTICNAYIMTTFHRLDDTPRPTLNGQLYLAKKEPDEAALWSWMNKNIYGTPVTVEAVGDSYQGFTRGVMHTGLPTILGWQYHVLQRGTKQEDIERRREAVRQIYLSNSAANTTRLLQRYDAQFVIVGDLERKTYGAEGLEKFGDRQFFKKEFEQGSAALYSIRKQ